MTKTPQSWSFAIPKAFDEDNDPVTVTANFGFAANFVEMNSPDSIEIEDISEGGTSNIREGMYLMSFSLDDGKDQVNVPFTLFVIAAPPDEVELVIQDSEAPQVDETVNTEEEELTEEQQLENSQV